MSERERMGAILAQDTISLIESADHDNDTGEVTLSKAAADTLVKLAKSVLAAPPDARSE